MELPGNEGYLALDLDDQAYKKVELEGFPSIASLYEHDKAEDIKSDAAWASLHNGAEEGGI